MALGNKTLDDLVRPISKQLGHDSVAEHVDAPTWEFKAQRVTDGMNHGQLVDKFADEAAKVRVYVRRTTRDGLAGCLASIVGAGVPGTGEPCAVVAADDELLATAFETIRAQQLVEDLHVWDAAKGAENVTVAEKATYGITHAAAGIAETGTVVQLTNAQCGRSVSLLPLVHVAVVDGSTIQPTMLEIMQAYGDDASKLASQVCFISGPSATADIELVRVEGVHGPMYVHYVIVE